MDLGVRPAGAKPPTILAKRQDDFTSTAHRPSDCLQAVAASRSRSEMSAQAVKAGLLERPAERTYFGALEGPGAGLLLHGFTAGFALAATLGVAASVGGTGGLLLHGFTLAALLVAGLGVVACVGATAEPLFQGLGFPEAVAEGDASGALLPWPQPPRTNAIRRGPANRFNVSSSHAYFALLSPLKPIVWSAIPTQGAPSRTRLTSFVDDPPVVSLG
jgi:hypothetical protein